MRNLLFLLSKVHALLLFIILEIIAFSFIFRSHTYQRIAIANTSSRFTGYFYNKLEGWDEYFGLKEKNQHLMEENAWLKARLKYEANYPKKDSILPKGDSLYSYSYIPAKVINNTIYKTHNYITINKGKKDGIKPDMGIMDSRGLAGIVSNVSENYALAISLLNTDISISVKHKKSNAFGNLKWHGFDPTTITVEDISKTANVKKGDTIITSGYSTIFPPGFPVGIVKKVNKNVGSGFQQLDLTPTTDLNKIEYIYVLQRNKRHEVDSLENVVQKIEENVR